MIKGRSSPDLRTCGRTGEGCEHVESERTTKRDRLSLTDSRRQVELGRRFHRQDKNFRVIVVVSTGSPFDEELRSDGIRR